MALKERKAFSANKQNSLQNLHLPLNEEYLAHVKILTFILKHTFEKVLPDLFMIKFKTMFNIDKFVCEKKSTEKLHSCSISIG